MGLLDIFKKKKRTLMQDIPPAADWIVTALNSSGYKADYTLESMKEIDRFYDEQNKPGGIFTMGSVGSKLFALGCYVGETIIKLYGGEWVTNDKDPQGEINIQVKLSDGSIIWPVQKTMKRYQLGSEESIYDYVYVIGQQVKK